MKRILNTDIELEKVAYLLDKIIDGWYQELDVPDILMDLNDVLDKILDGTIENIDDNLITICIVHCKNVGIDILDIHKLRLIIACTRHP
jgi:hypothetical protein